MLTPDAHVVFHAINRWVDAERKLRVLANADSPDDAAMAKTNGAEGIGLCRTEHMFFSVSIITQRLQRSES